MKLRSREINIFSMSALDLFASALGAFMLLSIISLPFFPNTGDSPGLAAEISGQLQQAEEELEQVESELTQSEQVAAELRGELDRLRQSQSDADEDAEVISQLEEQIANLEKALQQTFVLVVISWGSTDDVDLHVVDPRGNEYYYDAARFAGSDAALEEDNVRGPGNEIWLSPKAIQGQYQVYLNMYNKREPGAVGVRASILHQNGREILPDTTMSASGEKPLIMRFEVDSVGAVNLL